MVSQEGARERKILRVDDETETAREIPPPQPTTREQVTAQNPAVAENRPINPRAAQKKYAASYQRMQEIKAETQQEIDALAHAAHTAGNLPVPPQEPFPAQLQQPVVEQPQEQPLQYDLSLLALTGEVNEEVVVGGFKFRLRTLTARENNEVLREVAQVQDDLEKIGCLRIAVLARAVVTVNGVPLERVPGTDQEIKNVVERKNVFLGNLQLAMLVRLFNTYTDLLEHSEGIFDDLLKKEDSLKN